MVWKCSDVSADKVTSCPGDKLTSWPADKLTSWQADQLPRRRSRLSGCGEKAPTLCPSSIHSSIPRDLCISNSMLIFANRPIFNSHFSHYGPDQSWLIVSDYTELYRSHNAEVKAAAQMKLSHSQQPNHGLARIVFWWDPATSNATPRWSLLTPDTVDEEDKNSVPVWIKGIWQSKSKWADTRNVSSWSQ